MATSLIRLRVFAFFFFLCSRLADAKVQIVSSKPDMEVGTDQLLLCKADKDGDITWTKDGEDVDDARHLLEKVDENTSKLYLKKVELKDSGVYQCNCEFENHEVKETITIFVYENLNFGETKTYHEFLVNQTVQVPCVVTGKPEVEVSWYRDGHPVSNDGRTFARGYRCAGSGHLTVLPDRNLQIANIQKSDHGTYSCVGRFKERPQIHKELDISVVVNVPPTVLIHRDRMNVHAGPDTNVTIICLVEGVPKPTISWTTPSTSNSSRYTYNSDKSELIIPGVTRSDFGEYICTATNKLGENSDTLTLDVSERPSVILSQNQILAKAGDLVTVSCNATGHPSPSTEWLDHKGKKVEGSDSELIFTNVKPSDGGVYSCQASNHAGSNKEDFRLITTPSVPIYFTVTPGPTSAHIELRAPIEDGGSPITSYIIQWRKTPQDNWNQTVIPTNSPGHLVLTSLAPYTQYFIRFAAKNDHFVGGLSAETKIRTQAKREPDRPVLSSSDGKIEGNSYSIPIKQLDDGGSPVLNYLVRYRMDKEGEDWKETKIAANSTKIYLQNLHYNSDYKIEVLAFNVNGSSSPAKLNFSVPQAVHKPSLGKGGVAAIVIVIFLLLLVAVDAFCCYTNHCGLLNFLARKFFGHKVSEAKSVEDGVINNAAVDLKGLEKPSSSLPKLQPQNGATNGVQSEVTCDKAPLTKFEKPPANGDSPNEARL